MLRPGSPGSLSAKGLKLSHLRFMAALGRSGQVSRAASDLGLTQPAASRLAAEIQRILGQPVYERTGRGVELTPAGRTLALRAARALQEIDDAGRDIAEMQNALSGEVRVGAVTGPALEHVLPVVRAGRLAIPGVTIGVEVATSDILCAQLLDGRLDFALARLGRDSDADQFSVRPVATEPMSLVVRPAHPLSRQQDVPAAALLDYHWVLPFEGAILRRAVDAALRRRGLPPPPQVFVTSSFLLTLALVQETNAIAPVATSVARAFGRDGSGVRTLTTDLAIEVETYGLVRRAGRLLTPAAAAVLAMLEKQLDSAPPPRLEVPSALA